MYADGLVMISTTKEGLQNMLNKLDEYSQKWNIDVNYTKKKESHRFTINSQIIENSTTYKYLGITIHKNGSFKAHLSELAGKTNKAIFLMNRKLNIKFIPKKIISSAFRHVNMSNLTLWVRDLGTILRFKL